MFFQIHIINKFAQFAQICLKDGSVNFIYCHKVLDCHVFNLYPFSKFCKLCSFSKISADVFSLSYFMMNLENQFWNFLNEDVLLGWRGCKLLRIHGRRIQKYLCVFVPWPINWTSCHWKSLVHFSPLLSCALSKQDLCVQELCGPCFGCCIHERQDNFLEHSYTHPCSVRPWCVSSCGNSRYDMHSVKCQCVVGWRQEMFAQIAFGFISNVSIHSWNFARPVDEDLLLHGQCDVAPSKTVRNPIVSPRNLQILLSEVRSRETFPGACMSLQRAVGHHLFQKTSKSFSFWFVRLTNDVVLDDIFLKLHFSSNLLLMLRGAMHVWYISWMCALTRQRVHAFREGQIAHVTLSMTGTQDSSIQHNMSVPL